MNFERILTGLPVQPVADYLKANPGFWNHVTWRQEFAGSPQHDTRCIFLRWCPGNTIQDVFYQLEAVDCPASPFFAPVIGPVLVPLLEKVIGPNWDATTAGRVMLTTLKPGGVIDLHSDGGDYAERHDRFHVVIASEPGNVFTVAGEEQECRPGEAFWFNVKKPHKVENHSAKERIHLIIDLVAPAYRAKRGTYMQLERWQSLWPDLKPLLEDHWREVAHYQDIALDPNYEKYCQMQDQGHLRCWTVRDGGRLVGYGLYIVTYNLHYQTSIQAQQDVVFVHPDYRKGITGYRLLKFCDEQLRQEGVQAVYHHVKRAHNWSPLLVHMGYELVDLIYARRLDKD